MQQLYSNFVKRRITDILRSYERRQRRGFNGGINIVVEFRLLMKGRYRSIKTIDKNLSEILDSISMIKGKQVKIYYPRKNKKYVHIFVNTRPGKKELKYQLNSRDIDYGVDYVTQDDKWYESTICI